MNDSSSIIITLISATAVIIIFMLASLIQISSRNCNCADECNCSNQEEEDQIDSTNQYVQPFYLRNRNISYDKDFWKHQYYLPPNHRRMYL